MDSEKSMLKKVLDGSDTEVSITANYTCGINFESDSSYIELDS